MPGFYSRRAPRAFRKQLTLYQSHRDLTPRGQTYNAPESFVLLAPQSFRSRRPEPSSSLSSNSEAGGAEWLQDAYSGEEEEGGIVRYIFAENSPRSGSNGPISSTWTKPLFHLVGPFMMRGNPPPNGRL